MIKSLEILKETTLNTIYENQLKQLEEHNKSFV